MSIYAAIRDQWENTTTLNDLLPVAQFTEGWRLDNNAHIPLAWLALEVESKLWTNSRPIVVTTCRIQAYVAQHIDGVNLKAAMEEAFDNTDWTTGTIEVIKSRIENSFCLQDPDDPNIWQFVFLLETEHWEA